MRNPQSHEREARLAGFFVVLAMHGAVLYGLWQDRVLPSPSESATLYVDLLEDPPGARLPKPAPLRARVVKPVERTQSLFAQRFAAQAPVSSAVEPVAPPSQPQENDAPVESAPPPASARPTAPIALGGDLAKLCPERTPPAYPLLSRKLGEAGKAVLRVELDESGRIDNAAVRSSSGYARLDEAALMAVKRWRCNPAVRNGLEVRAVALQPFNFVLEGR
jgi:protein TonB